MQRTVTHLCQSHSTWSVVSVNILHGWVQEVRRHAVGYISATTMREGGGTCRVAPPRRGAADRLISVPVHLFDEAIPSRRANPR